MGWIMSTMTGHRYRRVSGSSGRNRPALALCVLISLDHMEWEPPEGSLQSAALAGGLGPRGYPDYPRLTHRDYGHRVGIFRVFEVLEKYRIPATVAMDALTAEHYPELVRHCQRRGCEIIRRYIGQSDDHQPHDRAGRARVYSHRHGSAGSRHRHCPGWMVWPGVRRVARTPQLLAQAGIRYVCDWTNDEQPYRMKTAQGELFALPIMLELDDVHALWYRRVPIDRYEQLLCEL